MTKTNVGNRTDFDIIKDTYVVSIYCQISNIRCNKSETLNVSCLVLQLSLPNPLGPGIEVLWYSLVFWCPSWVFWRKMTVLWELPVWRSFHSTYKVVMEVWVGVIHTIIQHQHLHAMARQVQTLPRRNHVQVLANMAAVLATVLL